MGLGCVAYKTGSLRFWKVLFMKIELVFQETRADDCNTT